MYELMILSILIRWPTHGYRIARIINDMIGPYAKMSNGRLYPLLSQMEVQGLIEAVKEARPNEKSGRNQQSYAITEEGSVRFHELMMDTTSNPGDYRQIFLQKVPTLRYLKPSERLYLIDHYINYCQAHILHQMAESEDLRGRSAQIEPIHIEAVVNVMQHLIDQWQLELDWAKSLRQWELSRSEELDETGKGMQHERA